MKFLLALAAIVAVSTACRHYERARDHTGAEIYCRPHDPRAHACGADSFCGSEDYCCDLNRPKRCVRALDHLGDEIYCRPHDTRNGHACPSHSYCGEDDYCCEGDLPSSSKSWTTTRAPTTRPSRPPTTREPETTRPTRPPTTRTPDTTTRRSWSTTTRSSWNRGCRYGVARDHTGAELYCGRSGHACMSGAHCGSERYCCWDRRQ
eukprot:m.28615 g.28615  ORF g.28615 m.28615 type:complete len:206 (+) comp9056_c1_seq3:1069-1686(+)